MNRIGSLIAVIFAATLYFLPLMAVSQSVETLSKIQTIFLKGNPEGLESVLNDEVVIGWEGKKNKYSKAKAANWIKEFLKDHPSAAFEYVHKGTSKDGIQYAIGKYTSGSDFWRIYILIKENKGKYLLDTVDMSKE